MSDSTPDLSKIIGVIMENPDIVKRISELASMNTKSQEADATVQPVSTDKVEPVTNYISDEPTSASKRRQLLGALRPYMNESRSRAMDSMMAIADVIDMMKER